MFENVALPLTIAGYQPREVGRRVRAALAKVGLGDKEKQLPIALSGGEQQRVGIVPIGIQHTDGAIIAPKDT